MDDLTIQIPGRCAFHIYYEGEREEVIGTYVSACWFVQEQSNNGYGYSAKTIQTRTFLKYIRIGSIIIIYSTTTIIHIPCITLWRWINTINDFPIWILSCSVPIHKNVY